MDHDQMVRFSALIEESVSLAIQQGLRMGTAELMCVLPSAEERRKYALLHAAALIAGQRSVILSSWDWYQEVLAAEEMLAIIERRQTIAALPDPFRSVDRFGDHLNGKWGEDDCPF
jgi:hypothetical protein